MPQRTRGPRVIDFQFKGPDSAYLRWPFRRTVQIPALVKFDVSVSGMRPKQDEVQVLEVRHHELGSVLLAGRLPSCTASDYGLASHFPLSVPSVNPILKIGLLQYIIYTFLLLSFNVSARNLQALKKENS